jgi:hypothetical protein
MKNQLEITFEGEYIKVLSNGEKDLEFASRLWSQTVDACQKYDCFKILGIAETTSPVTTIEAFDHADLFKKIGITSKYRIAWVELNPEAYKTTDFIETVLSNRSLPGRLFSDESEAKKWLMSERNT